MPIKNLHISRKVDTYLFQYSRVDRTKPAAHTTPHTNMYTHTNTASPSRLKNSEDDSYYIFSAANIARKDYAVTGT